VSRRGSKHVVGGDLELEGVTEQVKDERKVKVWNVYKVVFLLVEIVHKVSLKLPAVVPRIVDVRGELLRGVQHWIGPGEPLDHLSVEAVERVQRPRRLLEALLAFVVLIELETDVESLDVVVQGRARVLSLRVDALLKLFELGLHASVVRVACVGDNFLSVGAEVALPKFSRLIEVGSPNVRGLWQVLVSVSECSNEHHG